MSNEQNCCLSPENEVRSGFSVITAKVFLCHNNDPVMFDAEPPIRILDFVETFDSVENASQSPSHSPQPLQSPPLSRSISSRNSQAFPGRLFQICLGNERTEDHDEPPSKETIAFAEKIFEELIFERELPMPVFDAPGDGTLEFFWREKRLYGLIADDYIEMERVGDLESEKIEFPIHSIPHTATLIFDFFHK